MAIVQHSMLPEVADNELHEPVVKRPSVPVALFLNGRWCWKAFGTETYIHEPELERILLAALEKRHDDR